MYSSMIWLVNSDRMTLISSADTIERETDRQTTEPIECLGKVVRDVVVLVNLNHCAPRAFFICQLLSMRIDAQPGAAT